MNFKTTLVLLALLAVVGGAVAYVLRNDPGESADPGDTTSRDGRPVFAEDDAFEAGDVMAITLTRDGETVEIQREGDGWFQVSPVRFQLSGYGGPDAIAEAAATLAYLERFDPGESGKPTLTDVKLDPPHATVAVTLAPKGDDEPITRTVALSGRPVGGTGYALIDDRPEAYVVKDNLHNAALSQRPIDWRARSLPVPETTRIQRLRLRHSDADIQLHRTDGNWYLGEATDQRADREAVEALVDAIRVVFITDFDADAPDSLAPFGLERPALAVTMTAPAVDGKPEQSWTLSVGGSADLKNQTRFATWSSSAGETEAGGDVVFTITDASATALRPAIDGLRDSRITTALGQDITRLRIERANAKPIHLVQDGATINFADPKPDYAPDRTAWRDLVSQVTSAQATAFRTAYEPAAEPLATVTLNTTTSREPETVRLYPGDTEAVVIAHRDGESIGYIVDRAELAGAFAPRVALRDRNVLAIDDADLESIELQRGSETFVFMPEAEGDGAWSLEGPDALEPATFEALRNEITLLRARDWSEGEGRLNGDLILTLSGKDGTLTVLEADSGTGRAILTGVDAEFRLSDRTLDVLDAEFRDRVVLALTIDQIDRVTVTQGVLSLAVERGAAGDYSAAGADLDQTAAAGLFDTLAGLRADRYRAIGTVKMDPAAPSHTLTIQTAVGQRTLQLWPGTANDFNLPMGRLDDAPRTFDLSEEDYTALTATLVAPPEAPAD